jgi:hypothetical protein
MFFREDQLIELCDFSYFHQVGELVPALAAYILSLIIVSFRHHPHPPSLMYQRAAIFHRCDCCLLFSVCRCIDALRRDDRDKRVCHVIRSSLSFEMDEPCGWDSQEHRGRATLANHIQQGLIPASTSISSSHHVRTMPTMGSILRVGAPRRKWPVIMLGTRWPPRFHLHYDGWLTFESALHIHASVTALPV